MIPYRLIAYGVAVLAVIGALYGIYHSIDSKAYERGKAEIKAEWEEANRKQREADEQRITAAGRKLEEGSRASRVIYKTITKTVDRLVASDPGLARDCVDSRGVRVANDALAGSISSAPESDGAVPSPDAARGRDWSLTPAKDSRDRGGISPVRTPALGAR